MLGLAMTTVVVIFVWASGYCAGRAHACFRAATGKWP